MQTRLALRCADLGRPLARALRQHLLAATKRAEPAVAENAFLRQQLLVLRRGCKRPRCTPTDRALLVLLASRLRSWRQALRIVQPETVLRRHRQGFRLFWRRKSRPRSSPQPKERTITCGALSAFEANC